MKQLILAHLVLIVTLISADPSLACSRAVSEKKYDIGYYPKGVLPLTVFLTAPISSILTLTELERDDKWIPGLLALLTLPLIICGPPGASNQTESFNLVDSKKDNNETIVVTNQNEQEKIKYLFSKEMRKMNYKLLGFGLLINVGNALTADADGAKQTSWVGAALTLTAFFIDTSRYFWLSQPDELSIFPIIDGENKTYSLNLRYTF